MNKKFKALLTCLALTATMGAMTACDQLQGVLPEMPFLDGILGATSSESQVESESTSEKESSSEKEETPELGKNESTVTFVVDGETVETKVYSVEEYCYNALAMTAEDLGYSQEKYEAFQNWVVDLLKYGAQTSVSLPFWNVMDFSFSRCFSSFIPLKMI